eukprot:2396108-Alexandrium_andersonii.AAC.1
MPELAVVPDCRDGCSSVVQPADTVGRWRALCLALRSFRCQAQLREGSVRAAGPPPVVEAGDVAEVQHAQNARGQRRGGGAYGD